MAEADLKSKAIGGALWTATEKFIRQGAQFVIGIVLARILAPDDYGIVGMLAIFIAIANTFADSGLSNALIQKQDCTDDDYSTIFYFNVAVALGCYALLFLSAPSVASFYEMPILTDVMRVVSLSIIISGLTAVQNTRLTKQLRFRLQSKISIVSVFVAGATGLTLAFRDWGVWALVFQALAGQIFTSVCIWCYSKWMPKLRFSVNSFRQLWRFGSKLLCSSLINTLYQNLYTLVIGKCFTPAQVGYYNRGNGYASIPVNTVTDMSLKVTYPILAKLQDDDERLLRAYSKLLRIPLYILYPILTAIAVTSVPLIEFMIGEKWLPCAPLLSILCIGGMFTPLTQINLNLLYVKGRTDLVLRLELIKKPIAFLILFASIPFGIIIMVVGKALYEFVAFSFNCYYTGKILNYGELKQLRDLLPIFINCAVMAGVMAIAMTSVCSPWIKLLVAVPCGLLSYWIFSILTKDASYIELKEILLKKLSL